MSLLRLAYAIALRRIVSSWRLELALFLGILLAVALLSSGIVFSDFLAEAALRRSLVQAPPNQANFSTRVYGNLDDPAVVPKEASTYQSDLDFVDRWVGEPFAPYLESRSLLLQTATFFYQGHPQLELDDEVRPRGKLQYMTGLGPDSQGWDNRVEVVAGHWPYSTSGGALPAHGMSLEVAIDTRGSEILQLGLGDHMEIFPAAGDRDPPIMTAEIVGIFRRANPDDEFWYGTEGDFSYQSDRWTIVPLFTTEDAIVRRVAAEYPGLHHDTTWFYYLDRAGVRARDVGTIQDRIAFVEYYVPANLDHANTAIKLDDVLDFYEEQILLARIPLFLMVFMVTAILLFYLSLVTGLIVRSRATEISMLKSRGATTFQISLLALVEGLILSVPALAFGPLLALAVARALGKAFFDVETGGEAVPVVLSSQAFLLGVGGAFLAVAVFTFATFSAARHGIVEFRQAGARPPKAPFIHRYYLDVLLLVFILVILWQLQNRGSFLVRSLGSGELEIDYSLLLGPVLVLLALGLFVLRAFPWAVALLSWVAERVGPVWLVQGSRRIARDPIVPGTLVVLLMVSTALGVIGSSFSSTLERSQRERALYAAGADLRVRHEGDAFPVSLLGLSEPAKGLDGVQGAAEVMRTSGHLLLSGFASERVSVLAVDSERIGGVAWYRNDFGGGKSLDKLTRNLIADPATFPAPPLAGALPGAADGLEVRGDGVQLPSDATGLALWINPGRVQPRLSLRARLQDTRGYYFDVIMGELNFKGWRRIEANLSPIPPRRRLSTVEPQVPVLRPPFTFLSLQVYSRRGLREPGILFIDRLAAISPDGEHVLADFSNGPLPWHVVEDYDKPGLYALELSPSVSRSPSGTSTAFSWSPGGIGTLQGIRAGRLERPIPAIVSRTLLEKADIRLGESLTISLSAVSVPVQAVAVADYFPTMEARKEPFLVVDLKTYNHIANLHSERPLGGSDELWVSLDGAADPAAAARAPGAITQMLRGRNIIVRDSQLASDMVSQRVSHPLVNAGWGGLLVLMFLALVLASGSGVILFLYMDTRDRQTEFALLRTMGFTRRQLNGVVWLNLFLVLICGIGLGSWAGQVIGNSLLPLLEVGEGGVRVTPPMVLDSHWVTLLVSYLFLGGLAIFSVVWLAWLTSKLEVQQVLRIGEA